MTLEDSSHIWTVKGATLSDKNAKKEYDISQEEIIAGIRAGKLQHRINSAHGNPYLKLIRAEIEALITEKYGKRYLEKMALNTKLKKIALELRSLKRRTNQLAKEKIAIEQQLAKLEAE